MVIINTDIDSLERGRGKKAFLYRQLADILKESIRSGEYSAGDRLPSMDDLTAAYSLTKTTVRRALDELRQEGWIYISPARGSFVEDSVPVEVGTAGRAGGFSDAGGGSASDGRSAAREPVAAASGPSGVDRPATPSISRRYRTIGVMSRLISPGEGGLYHMEMLDSIRQGLGQSMANMLLLPANLTADDPVVLLDMLQSHQLDGMIYVGDFRDETLRRLVAEGPRAVLLDHAAPDGLAVDCITIDNRGGARQAVTHLLELGHRRIGVLCGPPDQIATTDRRQGVAEAIAAAGMSVEVLEAVGHFTREGGQGAANELLDGAERPTAFFCMNDEMALGCLQVLHERGIQVPGEVSLVGFDNVMLTLSSQPALTTVAAPMRLMGREAARLLLDYLEEDVHFYSNTVLGTRLIQRRSTQGVAADLRR